MKTQWPESKNPVFWLIIAGGFYWLVEWRIIVHYGNPYQTTEPIRRFLTMIPMIMFGEVYIYLINNYALCLGRYPLVMTNSSPWFFDGPNRNRWFTYEKWWIFPWQTVSHNQMVPIKPGITTAAGSQPPEKIVNLTKKREANDPK